MVESIVFTSQLSEKELFAKIRKQQGCLYCGFPILIAFVGFTLFLPAYSIFIIIDNHIFYGVSILVIITMLGFEIYFLKSWGKVLYNAVKANPAALKNMRDNIPSKEFAWDARTQQFRYKDKERIIRFISSDVRKWCKRDGYLGYLIAIRLKNDEQIILEEIFNPDAFTFLSEHAEELHLPLLLQDNQRMINPYSELI